MLGKKDTGNERYWQNLSRIMTKQEQIKIINYQSNINNGLYRILFGFQQMINQHKPDLLHVQNFAPWQKTVPIVLTIHDLCFKENPNWFGLKTRLAFQFFFKRSLALADVIICVSKYTRKQLLNYYKVDSKKIKVIYEAADDCFCYSKNRKVLKRQLKLKYQLSEPYFLVVGNVEERKQPRLIINAFKKVLKEHPKAKLIFAGPNKLKLIASKNIKFLGYVADEDLNLLYNGATAFIYFSLCEGFGLPLVETMACQTPIICSDIPVFREIVGLAGLYAKNEFDLCRAMQKTIENKALCEKYANLAKKRGRLYSWQKTAKQTLGIYNKLVLSYY